MAKTILIIEDEIAIQNIVRAFLEDAGYTVYGAGDGLEGIETFRKCNPDLVLLDLMLPKLSGFDVCKLLKTDDGTWRIPVVIMSTLSDPQSRDRATEAGADYFIPKPYDLASTLAEIKKILKI